MSAPVKTSAHLCRERGWGVGTVLEGIAEKFPGMTIRIRITGVGEDQILARVIAHKFGDEPWGSKGDSYEGEWPEDCSLHGWKAVDPEPAPIKEEWYASRNEDEFSAIEGPYGSRDEAIWEGRAAFAGDVDTFYTGLKVRGHVPKIDASRVIDDLQEFAYDDVAEGSQGWLDNLPKGALEALQAGLDSILRAWLVAFGQATEFPLIDRIEGHQCQDEPPAVPDPESGP